MSPNVVAALAKSLEKLPADRFTSAAEFATALGDPSFTYEARVRTSVTASTPEPVATQAPATVPGPWNRLTVAFATAAVLIAGLAVWDWLAPQPALQPTRAVVDFGDLTLGGPSEILVSPDGSRLAVAGILDGQPGLYWRDAAEEDFRLIPGTEGNFPFVSFSPDSEWLAYTDVGAEEDPVGEADEQGACALGRMPSDLAESGRDVDVDVGVGEGDANGRPAEATADVGDAGALRFGGCA